MFERIIRKDSDGQKYISAEDGEGLKHTQYFDPPTNWENGISPELEKFLRMKKLRAEWNNPGRLNLYKA